MDIQAILMGMRDAACRYGTPGGSSKANECALVSSELFEAVAAHTWA